MDFAFLHGGGQGGWIWDETIAAMQAQAGEAIRTIAFDLPGCGAKSEQDVSGLTVRDVAAVFTADLDASGLRDPILVGHSNAGTILPLVAKMRPDLVRRTVYVSCIAPPPGGSIIEAMAKRPAMEGQADVPSGGRLHEMFCNDMEPDYATAFMARLHRDHWPTPQALRETDWNYDHLADRDSAYIITLRDQALFPDEQQVYAERLHAGRRILIDAGHQVMNTRPHGLAEILLAEGRRRQAG